ALSRQRWRLGTDSLGLPHVLKTPIDAIYPVSAVHVCEKLAEPFGLGLGGIDDGLSLLKRAASYPRGLGGLVSGAALQTCGQLARMFVGARALPLFRRPLLQRLKRALDGNGLGQSEVLPGCVLSKLAAHNSIEIDHRDGDVRPAEQLSGA